MAHAINVTYLASLKSKDILEKLNAFGKQCAKHMLGIRCQDWSESNPLGKASMTGHTSKENNANYRSGGKLSTVHQNQFSRRKGTYHHTEERRAVLGKAQQKSIVTCRESTNELKWKLYSEIRRDSEMWKLHLNYFGTK